ncbi:MAG: hypothetical protein AAFS11_07780, partial [Planctomycetota bacterium]
MATTTSLTSPPAASVLSVHVEPTIRPPHSRAVAHASSRLADLRVATLGVLAALLSALSVWAMPLAAQDLETFDPDEAFEQSAPDPT